MDQGEEEDEGEGKGRRRGIGLLGGVEEEREVGERRCGHWGREERARRGVGTGHLLETSCGS